MVPASGLLAGDFDQFNGCVRICISGEFDKVRAEDTVLKKAMEALEKSLFHIQEHQKSVSDKLEEVNTSEQVTNKQKNQNTTLFP